MELKTKYQYTYFIYPYIVNEKNYEKYLHRLLSSKDYTLETLGKEKEEDLYKYFLPKIRSTMLWSMEYDKNRLSKLDSLDKKMQATILAKYPCVMFEYNIKKDIQGKTDKKEGIFFNITKMEIICFNTGICFLNIKTVLDEGCTLADLCNFNYKFRDIKSNIYNLKGYENIRIQTDMFDDIKELTTLIKQITGNNKGARELNLETERFITYSYACIGQEEWNENTNNELLEKSFYKFANVEPSDSTTDLGIEKMTVIEKSKCEIYGISNMGTVLLTSDSKSENYTKVPYLFERQYLYNYIFELYKKIHLKKINYELKQNTRLKVAQKEFINFTQNIWIEEVTNDNFGSMLDTEWKKKLNIDTTYMQVKQKYDVVYKNANIEKTAKTNRLILVVLIILLIVNIINIINVF